MNILKTGNNITSRILIISFLILSIMSFVSIIIPFGPKEFNLTCKIALSIIFLLISVITSAFFRLDYNHWPWQKKRNYDDIELGFRRR